MVLVQFLDKKAYLGIPEQTIQKTQLEAKRDDNATNETSGSKSVSDPEDGDLVAVGVSELESVDGEGGGESDREGGPHILVPWNHRAGQLSALLLWPGNFFNLSSSYQLPQPFVSPSLGVCELISLAMICSPSPIARREPTDEALVS